LAALLLSPVLRAATFVVDTSSALTLNTCSAAPNDCSLSGAINRANADAALDTIAFTIPTSDPGCVPATGVCTITPAPSQRLISEPALIDGFTQPGASPNTLTAAQGGLNSQIKKLLDGSSTNGVGLQLKGLHASVVRGLAIGRFASRAGILLPTIA